MASFMDDKRLSRYFFYKKEPVHTYATNNVFHFNPRGESVWTDEEKSALLHKVSTGSSAQRNWKVVAESTPSHSLMECYMQYSNVLDPGINYSEWTAEEDSHLQLLAEKYAEHHWVNIAEELGTRRTPMACLKRYQRTHNTKLLNNDEWSAEEDLLLKAAVESCGKGKWLEVSLQVPGRSSVQCMNRWMKSTLCQDNVVSGKWVEEEERLLFLAAIAYDAPNLKQTKKSEAQLWDLYVQAGLEKDNLHSDVSTNNSSNSRNDTSTSYNEDVASSDSEDDAAISSIDINNRSVTTPTATNGTAQVQEALQSVANAATSGAGAFPHWKSIAALIPGKTEVHCREKWFNTLDPSVNAAAYSAAEDVRLARVVYALQRIQCGHAVTASSVHNTTTSSAGSILWPITTPITTLEGSSTADSTRPPPSLDTNCVVSLLTHTDTSRGIKWARVAQYLPGRTDASVRSRWNLLLKGISKAQPDKPIAPVTLRKRAAAQSKSSKRAKGELVP